VHDLSRQIVEVGLPVSSDQENAVGLRRSLKQLALQSELPFSQVARAGAIRRRERSHIGAFSQATRTAERVAVLNRIRIEERVLIDEYGDAYRAYKQATSQLIPFIY